MDRSIPPPRSGEIHRILDEVSECLRTGEPPNPRWYYLRFPHLEQELRGHFRRIGLVEDPFSNSAQFLREAPPWERSSAKEVRPSPLPAATEAEDHAALPDHQDERKLLLENVSYSGAHTPGGRLGRRARAAAVLALTFAAGWAGLMLLSDPWRVRSPSAEEASRIEGLAALSTLAAGWPAAKEDLLLEGIDEADRAAREGGRWEIRWLRYLMLADLGREEEARQYLESVPQRIRDELTSPAEDPRSRALTAGRSATSRALAALGEVITRKPERARTRLGPEAPAGSLLLLDLVRGAAFPGERRRVAERLLRSANRHTRLLGAAWGVQAGLGSARAALGEIPLAGLAEARMLVELGGEEEFLRRARPGRVDLAPLRIRVLKKRGDRAGALRLSQEMIASQPDSFDLRMAAGELLRETGDCERSREHLLAATLMRPDSPEPMREWFRLALRCPEGPDLIAPCAELFLGRSAAEARARLAAGTPAGGDRDSERLLAGCGFGLPTEEEARERAVALLRRAALGSSGSPALTFLLGRTLFAQGLWREAARAFAAAAEESDPREEPAIRAWQAASSRRAGTSGARPADLAPAPRSGGGTSGRAEAPGIAKIDLRGGAAVPRQERGARPGGGQAAARLFASAEAGPTEPEKTVEALAGRVDLERTGLSTLEDYARALEETGAWQTAMLVRLGILEREPGVPARRIEAGWAAVMSGNAASAEAILEAGVPGAAPWDDPLRREPGEECMVRAFLAAGAGDLDLAADWLGAAIRREPVDARPWFLRGYFLDLNGSQSASRRDWDEVRALVGSPPPGLNPATVSSGAGGVVLEPAALPFLLALVGAARGDAASTRWHAALGPPRARTLLGSFFRAAALAASGDWAAAESEALSYRASGYPVAPWQRLDPWVGSIFGAGRAATVPSPPGPPEGAVTPSSPGPPEGATLPDAAGR